GAADERVDVVAGVDQGAHAGALVDGDGDGAHPGRDGHRRLVATSIEVVGGQLLALRDVLAGDLAEEQGGAVERRWVTLGDLGRRDLEHVRGDLRAERNRLRGEDRREL